MKYSKGDTIVIKPKSWFDHNQSNLEIKYRGHIFSIGMSSYCGRSTKITQVYNGFYVTDLGSFPVADWMIDMYSTDTMLYAKAHNLLDIKLDQDIIDKANMSLDSNDKYLTPDQKCLLNDSNTPYESKESKELPEGASKNKRGFTIVNGVRISNATGKPVRKYSYTKSTDKKKSSQNTVKPISTGKAQKKLEFGTKVIAYNDKLNPEVNVGRYEGSDEEGYLVRVSHKTIKHFKYIRLYKESVLKELILHTFKTTDQSKSEYTKLINIINNLVHEYEQKFNCRVKIELFGYDWVKFDG